VTADGIKADLTVERPLWPLSAYGPGLNAPRQLIEGDLEQSFEEVRLQYCIAQAAGTTSAYVG
jgi:nucleoporin NUP42